VSRTHTRYALLTYACIHSPRTYTCSTRLYIRRFADGKDRGVMKKKKIKINKSRSLDKRTHRACSF